MEHLNGMMEEFENELEYEFDGDFEAEYGDDLEFDDFEAEYETEFDEEIFSDDEELELAEQLLSAGNDEELEYFLGSLIRKAAPMFGRLLRGGGKKLVRGLARRGMGMARRFLPGLGRRAARAIGNRRFGQISNLARSFFGFELEMLPPEEQELEIAKKIIKTTKAAARNLAKAASQGAAPTPQLINKALKAAARQHMRPGGKKDLSSRRSQGRWIRKGNKIILMGA